MCHERSGCAGARRTAGFLLVSFLTCAFLPAQQRDPNGLAKAAAAEVGQKVPGPSGGPDRAKGAGEQPAVVEDPVAARQEMVMRKLRMEDMRKQASELAELAKSLQEDIEKSQQNVLPAGIPEKTKKIEKLAGKIRSEARY